MSNEEPLTPVLFRMSEGGVVAVFPTLYGEPRCFSCYSHIGQHSSCSKEWYRTTKPATPKQYASLKRELEAAPYEYRLKIIKRWPS